MVSASTSSRPEVCNPQGTLAKQIAAEIVYHCHGACSHLSALEQ